MIDYSKAYTYCPYCGDRIDLVIKKDFESFSGIEKQRHIADTHPETLTGFGLPYTQTWFEGEEAPSA